MSDRTSSVCRTSLVGAKRNACAPAHGFRSLGGAWSAGLSGLFRSRFNPFPLQGGLLLRGEEIPLGLAGIDVSKWAVKAATRRKAPVT